MVNQHIYSVTQLNQEIKNLLESNPSFYNLFVQGEISNYKAHPSGHHYMTLKDDGAAISAVLFRSDAARLRFRLANGLKIIAKGRVSSFPKSGQVQIYLSDLMPDGVGALHLQFEQTKQALYEQGRLDAAYKKQIPAYPMKIGLITSPSGAAVQDMLRILKRRWKCAQILLYPSAVQGVSAVNELISALKLANRHGQADVILMGRGGGSLEDLWAFNDEALAQAIFASKIPVISAVGHEPDVTISDLVADLRAPTPSGGAELATPDMQQVMQEIQQLQNRLKKAILQQIAEKQQFLQMQQARLHSPHQQLAQRRQEIDQMQQRLQRVMQNGLAQKQLKCDFITQQLMQTVEKQVTKKRQHFTAICAQLQALSPLQVLGRGYAVARDIQGNIVQDAKQLKQGDLLSVRFAHGTAKCEVQSIQEGGKAYGDEEKGNI